MSATAEYSDEELLAPVSVDEPHWYLTLCESGCLLCGAGGMQKRVRMAGVKPSDPAKCYMVYDVDWACDYHFM